MLIKVPRIWCDPVRHIQDICCKFLIWRSCRSLLQFQELCDVSHQSAFLRSTPELQTGYCRRKAGCLGGTEVCLDSPSCVVTVTIVSQRRYAMLLGDPEIRRGHGVLDYERGTLRWHGELLLLEMDPETQDRNWLCFCVDYRALNTITIKDVYPLPLTTRSSSRKWIYSTIDI